jgi:uncharacterized protein
VEPDPQPAIADGVTRTLDPRYIPLQRTVGGVTTVTLSFAALVGLLVFSVVESWPLWAVAIVVLLWLIASIGLGWLSYRWPEIEYRHISFTVNAIGIEIRTGVIWRKVINVARTRVQHTDVAQGPLDRKYGLGTLVIYTAGTEHAQVTLPGLEHGQAMQIRDHLLPREQADAV